MRTPRVLVLAFVLVLGRTNSSYPQSSWRWGNPLPQGNNLHAVQMFGAHSAIAAGDAGTIIRTSDSGATWSVQDHAGGLKSIYAMYFLDANTGFISGEALNDEGVLLKTTDGG